MVNGNLRRARNSGSIVSASKGKNEVYISRNIARQYRKSALLFLLGAVLVAGGNNVRAQERGQPWKRHTIDDSSRGADGVRLADVNGDGLMDLTTGWEEGGVIRVYLNPGPPNARLKWPAVTVGKVGSPEDAVFADLDGDGAADVVSCCEGNVKSMWVHWAPGDKAKYLVPKQWKTEPMPAARGRMQWMFCAPADVDGKNGVDLIAAGKGKDAQLGWFESPPNARDLGAWKWHPLRPVGWMMSIETADVDGDGDLDIVASDRKGERRGCFWLENPGSGEQQTRPWKEYTIASANKEVMFLTVTDPDRDQRRDVLVAVRGSELLYLRSKTQDGRTWESFPIAFPPNTGTGKAVRVADVDLDGKLDVIVTCENAANKSGVFWMSYGQAVTDSQWRAQEISGLEGVKYDLAQVLDLDGDGDLDVITCEEASNLGVIWYENPTRQK